MCLVAYWKSKLELMSPSESVTMTREDIKWLLQKHGHGSCGNTPEVLEPTEPTVGCDAHGPAAATELAPRRGRRPHGSHTIPMLAERFGKAQSTVRGWVASGMFGDPDRLKPNGRDYSVANSVVDEVESRLERGFRFADGAWLEATSAEAQDVPQTESIDSTESGASHIAAGANPGSHPTRSVVLARRRGERRLARQEKKHVGAFDAWRSAIKT